MNPRYPIYIISKGRAESRLTVKTLEYLSVPYKIVIEPQEFSAYIKNIDKSNILILPFSNLNQGSIPARNWIFEHAVSSGKKRHWIMDDNIRYFYRYNNNKKSSVSDGTVICCCEDFVDRYENIAMAGMNYDYFIAARSICPPYYLNTRIYSCILLDNSIPHRWRGRYNEDTDLSLRLLKDGYCTILFNAFLVCKTSTLVMSGGNTDTIYTDGDKRLKFAQSLQKQHPDVVKITWKYNRWHHSVNYRPFKQNRLIKKKNLYIQDKVNNYGMVLKKIVLKRPRVNINLRNKF